MGSSYNLKANEIEQLRKELSRLHDLPRGDEQEELRLQAHMDEISKRIDKIEGSFITAV
jgi:predicted nuclease with TOPRIM domain